MGGHFAKGVVLTLNSTVIGYLKTVTGPSISTDSVDVTTHDSPGRFKEFVAGLTDPGEITVEGNFSDASTINTAFLDSLNAGTVISGTIAMNGDGFGSTWSFSGFVTNFETQNPVDGMVGFTASIKLTGQSILTDDAS